MAIWLPLVMTIVSFEETVKIKGELLETSIETTIELGISAFIPKHIGNERTRSNL